MKKLILLLLVAPMIGNSQMLNLPVSDVIVKQGYEFTPNTLVPQGKIWQWTGISTSYWNLYLYFNCRLS